MSSGMPSMTQASMGSDAILSWRLSSSSWDLFVDVEVEGSVEGLEVFFLKTFTRLVGGVRRLMFWVALRGKYVMSSRAKFGPSTVLFSQRARTETIVFWFGGLFGMWQIAVQRSVDRIRG